MSDGPKPAWGRVGACLPAEFTGQARDALGRGKLLVVGLSVFADTDRARQDVADRLRAPGFATRMSGLGYSGDDIDNDIDIDNVSDRLVNALVAQGDPAVVGADHVVLPPVGGDFTKGVEHLERLSPAPA